MTTQCTYCGDSVPDADSSATVQPDTTNQIHKHGAIAVEHGDTTVDFNQPQYIAADGCFPLPRTRRYPTVVRPPWECDDRICPRDARHRRDRRALQHRRTGARGGKRCQGSVIVDGEKVDPQEYVLEGIGSVEETGNGAGGNVEIVVQSED